MSQKDRLATIGLGGNVSSLAGAPAETLVTALTHLASERSVHLLRVSRFIRSPAYPPGSGPDFVNAAALVATPLEPEALLHRLHAIEAALGRVRQTRWGARTVDLDLLGMDDMILPDQATLRHWIDLPPDRQQKEAPDRLILPHPRLQDRAFVLIPLAEIAPAWRHPLTGQTVAAMAKALSLDQTREIRLL